MVVDTTLIFHGSPILVPEAETGSPATREGSGVLAARWSRLEFGPWPIAWIHEPEGRLRRASLAGQPTLPTRFQPEL